MAGKIDLFKAALGNELFLAEVNSSPKKQLQFIVTLEENKFTPQEIIELIHTVKNHQVRSLLIIRLLSQKEYLNTLKGESLLDRLAYNTVSAIPSRLNAWVHQLDVRLITPELIKKLDPEAAISILCSIPHFHLLSSEQVDALLHKHLDASLIVYWIKHFASMPNAQYVLAHLMKLVSTNVIDALDDLEITKKEVIITRIIEHLNLFYPLPKRLLSLLNKESHLILAMKLYLNGHYYQAYTTFIEQLTSSLLNTKKSLSVPTIELLFSLNNVSELGTILARTTDLTNLYLRVNAQKGRVTPFYCDGHLNIQKMIQNAPLKTSKSKGAEIIIPADNTPNPQEKPIDAEEHPFVKSIIQQNKTINNFEYFLIYYRGDSQLIQQLLNDYLGYYGQQPQSAQRDKILHHLGFLLPQKELNTEVKEAIFAALVKHPELYDTYTSHQLFIYNASKTLRYFGFQGGEKNYQIIIDLCSLALNKLNPKSNPELIHIAQQAQHEARIELQLSRKYGFFSNIINYFKRCWLYGWTGFFTPNLPMYVLPESHTVSKKTFDLHEEDRELLIQPAKDLPAVLAEMDRKTLTQEKFEVLIDALNRYSLKDMQKNEFETRLTLHNLFYHVLLNKDRYASLYAWLMGNQGPFLNNQFRLLELSFMKGIASETEELIQQINKGPDKLKNITDELNHTLPEQKELSASPPHPESPDVLTNASEKISEYITGASHYAYSAWGWASNGLSGFKEGFFTKKDEKNVKETPPNGKALSCV